MLFQRRWTEGPRVREQAVVHLPELPLFVRRQRRLGRQRGILVKRTGKVEHGLKTASAANLDNVHTVYKRDLERYVGTLPPALMRDVCRALAVATGCGG